MDGRLDCVLLTTVWCVWCRVVVVVRSTPRPRTTASPPPRTRRRTTRRARATRTTTSPTATTRYVYIHTSGGLLTDRCVGQCVMVSELVHIKVCGQTDVCDVV